MRPNTKGITIWNFLNTTESTVLRSAMACMMTAEQSEMNGCTGAEQADDYGRGRMQARMEARMPPDLRSYRKAGKQKHGRRQKHHGKERYVDDMCKRIKGLNRIMSWWPSVRQPGPCQFGYSIVRCCTHLVKVVVVLLQRGKRLVTRKSHAH